MDADGRQLRFSARVNFESKELQIVILKRKPGDPGTYTLKPICLDDEASWRLKPEGEIIERASIAIPVEDVEKFLKDMRTAVASIAVEP